MTNIDVDGEGLKKSLEKRINESSCILNPKINEYLIKLLELEESAIKNFAISENELKALKKIDFFDSLVIYNLYNLVKKYISNNPNKKILSNLYGFLVEYREKDKTELLKFVNKEMSMYLYSKQPISEKERLKQIKEEIKKLEQRVDFFKECSYEISEQHKQLIAKKLHKLKQIKPELLEKQYELEFNEYQLQKQMAEQILEENQLTEKDFEEINMPGGKKFLIKKYPHSTIYIEK